MAVAVPSGGAATRGLKLGPVTGMGGAPAAGIVVGAYVLGEAGACRVLAGAAASGDLEAIAEILQAARAAIDGIADIPFSNRIAKADVHALNSQAVPIEHL